MTNTIRETRPLVAPVSQAERIWGEMRRNPSQRPYQIPLILADTLTISREARKAAYAVDTLA